MLQIYGGAAVYSIPVRDAPFVYDALGLFCSTV